jgi:uncharacterized protein (DUF433 family)
MVRHRITDDEMRRRYLVSPPAAPVNLRRTGQVEKGDTTAMDPVLTGTLRPPYISLRARLLHLHEMLPVERIMETLQIRREHAHKALGEYARDQDTARRFAQLHDETPPELIARYADAVVRMWREGMFPAQIVAHYQDQPTPLTLPQVVRIVYDRISGDEMRLRYSPASAKSLVEHASGGIHQLHFKEMLSIARIGDILGAKKQNVVAALGPLRRRRSAAISFCRLCQSADPKLIQRHGDAVAELWRRGMFPAQIVAHYQDQPTPLTLPQVVRIVQERIRDDEMRQRYSPAPWSPPITSGTGGADTRPISGRGGSRDLPGPAKRPHGANQK